MKINVLLSPLNADELYFANKTTVVIDVLRASTVIVNALANGAKEVIPVGTIEFAMQISGNAFGGQTLLGGERNTKKIEGFTLGNSPSEYSREIVEGKSIILFTTNGSKSIVKAKFSSELYIASFNNLESIVNHLIKLNKDVELLCSGKQGTFCIEDTVCAGKIIAEALKLDENIELTDSSRASIALNKSFGKNILKMIKESDHGKILAANDFAADLNACAKLNNFNIVPFYSSGTIKVLQQEPNKSNDLK